jgi:hypothetical protein
LSNIAETDGETVGIGLAQAGRIQFGRKSTGCHPEEPTAGDNTNDQYRSFPVR